MLQSEHVGNEADAITQIIRSEVSLTWHTLPAICVSVDYDAQTVVVQPTIEGSWRRPDGTRESAPLPLLVDVPIVWQRSGGWAITVPIHQGDECLIHIADRCIDAWWQSGGVQPAMTHRVSSLSDGFAVFGPASQARLTPGVSASALQIRHVETGALIEIRESGDIHIDTPGKLSATVGGNMQADVTGNVDVTAQGEMTLKASVISLMGATINLMGALRTMALGGGRGTARIDSDIDTYGALRNNDRNVGSGHTHGGVERGSSDTDGA